MQAGFLFRVAKDHLLGESLTLLFADVVRWTGVDGGHNPSSEIREPEKGLSKVRMWWLQTGLLLLLGPGQGRPLLLQPREKCLYLTTEFGEVGLPYGVGTGKVHL